MRRAFPAVLCLASLVACRPHSDPTVSPGGVQLRSVIETNIRDGAVLHYDPSVDYFPEKTSFRYTRQVRIDYHGHYKVLTLTPAPNPEEAFHYVLVQRGTPAPSLPGKSVIIEVPIRNFILTHEELMGAAEITGLANRLLAVSSIRNVREPGIRAGVDEGRIVAVGSTGHIDVERVIQLQPDAALIYWSANPLYNSHPVLDQAGIRTVVLASHWDTAPLAVAEWMKVIAVLFNRERDVNEIFDGIASRYEGLAARARLHPDQPMVVTRVPFRHIWSVQPTPDELVDAGARFFWPSHEWLYGIDIEAVARRARNADFWIMSFPTPIRTVEELLMREPRLFRAVQTGQVWNYDRQAFDNRAAYYDRPMRPDLVLADIVKIVHPELVPEHQFIFYRQLDRAAEPPAGGMRQ
jgi:iron complex transport system substrate-binding protein